MKLSESFFYTIKEDVKEEETVSGNLLARSGMIKKSSAGVYMFMPLGLRVLNKIENIIREEMNKAGAQELVMPSLIPEDVYISSGRRDAFGPSMFSLKDRNMHNYVLGPTHEELFLQAAAMKIKSYKDMPFNLYQIQTKYRDEARPRFGLIRTREFVMKDAYSFDKDLDGLDVSYNKMFNAYKNAFDRMNIKYSIVKADTGVMGGLLSEEFQAITEIGEDTVVLCDKCDFSSNIEVSPVVVTEQEKEELKEKELIETKDIESIEQIVDFLNIDIKKTVKTLVFNIDNEIVFALVRGDRELNTVKLGKLFGATSVEFATDEELKTAVDADFGSLGPIGAKAKIVIDKEIEQLTNFVVGANKTGYHYINTNLRDFNYDYVEDIINIKEGDICPKCGGKIYFKKGIEIGNTFKLGTKYSEKMNLKYLDQNNELQPVVMGSYGIGPARCMSAIVEQNNDEFGIIWPEEIAPFKVAIVVINAKDNDQMNLANKLYTELSTKVDVLLDDRDERPGFKFKDIDLIGIPYRIVVGKKASENIVEFKTRTNSEIKEVDALEVIKYL